MKKTLLILLLSSTYIFANINAIVSILPQQTFLKAIGGDKVNVSLMVEPGNSPHTYEPKPSQMVAVANAQLYFAMGVEFEHVWLPKFQNLNKEIKVVDLTQGIKKQLMESGGHTCSAHGSHEGHAHAQATPDPHVWTSPKNVKVIAQNIYDVLAKHDADNADFYKANLEKFLEEIAQTDASITTLLSKLEGSRSFMVFHPSWGYYAKAYDLKQIAIEVEGKSPKPRELIKLIKEAKKAEVTAIFTQPEFSDASAQIIANELKVPVVKISPMAPNWSENLIDMAKTIGGNN